MSYSPLQVSRRAASTRRLVVLMGALGVGFVVTGVRTIDLALQGEGEGAARAAAPEAVRRAEILDRNGVVLASTVMLKSAYAERAHVDDPVATAQALAGVIPGMDVAALTRHLARSDRGSVPVARGLSPKQLQAVFNLGLPGVVFRTEPRRVYPAGGLAGQVLGYVGVDQQGLGGVELSYDAELSAGKPVSLALDTRLQAVLEEELSWGIEAFSAIGGLAILIDATTGEVLALANRPGFDPNRAFSVPPEARTNPALHATLELGSVFKPLTIAGAIDAGAIQPSASYPTAGGVRVGGHPFTDKRPSAAPLSLEAIIAQSSNVGTVHVALAAGPRRQQDFYDALGLTAPVPIDLPGSAAPQLPVRWDERTLAFASFGSGLNVTPLALARAYTPFAREGELVELRVRRLEPDEAVTARRVMSAPTAAVMLSMMRATVSSGTARRLSGIGYSVAGKTGTANKPGVGGYDQTLRVTSFAAVLPAEAPRYVLYTLLDEPDVGIDQDEHADAGRTAVPVAGRIITRIAPVLGIMPSDVSPAATDAPITVAGPNGDETTIDVGLRGTL